MAPYVLEPVSFSAPRGARPLTITFRVPGGDSGSGKPLAPANALQVSVGDAFLARRPASDVEGRPGGVFALQEPAAAVPRFRVPAAVGDGLEVKLHAWRGERWLGTWCVGELGFEVLAMEEE